MISSDEGRSLYLKATRKHFRYAGKFTEAEYFILRNVSDVGLEQLLMGENFLVELNLSKKRN
jgi:hypothetical protein